MMPKFKFALQYNKNKEEICVLDVGCGNHSPSKTKRALKKCKYYGIDKELYALDDRDLSLMEKFYLLDLQEDNSLSVIPDNSFDIVFLTHVIEHTTNGPEIIKRVTAKINKGGQIYIEFPSIKSLYSAKFCNPKLLSWLPHFSGDSSHIRIYDIKELSNVLLSAGFKILKAGTRRNVYWIVLTPFIIIYTKLIKKMPIEGALWDILGFTDYVFAVKT